MKKAVGTNAVGRRKRAVSRVQIKEGEGKIEINGKTYEEHFGRETLRMLVRQPLEVIGKAGRYDVFVNVVGGGLAGQAGAVRHSIARALIKIDAENRSPLKKAGLLSRDQREVERKKYGRHKARKRPQFSKR